MPIKPDRRLLPCRDFLPEGPLRRLALRHSTADRNGLEKASEREYGAWRDYAVCRAGEDTFLDQDMAVLAPLWEGFKGAALGLSNGRGCA